MMVDPIAAWSSFLASPQAPKTAMSALELDGYLTGIIVTPQAAPIWPSAWVPRIWGDEEPVLADEAQINAALGAAMVHYSTLVNRIERSVARLEADHVVDYRPLFLSGAEKPRHDAVRIWVRGFGKAMALAPKIWTTLARDPRTSIIIARFVGFIDLGEIKPHDVPGDIDERLDEDAALIPRMILLLRMIARMREADSRPVPLRGQSKVGRNHPCPCGSGKKHKRCCGAD